MTQLRQTYLGALKHDMCDGVLHITSSNELKCIKCGKRFIVDEVLAPPAPVEGFCCGQQTKDGHCSVCGDKL